MAIFEPTSAFRSVDLPAFGRPRMETNPERNPGTALVSGCRATAFTPYGLRFSHPNPLHTPLVARQHVDMNAVALDRLAGLWHSPQPLARQAADRRRFDFLLRPVFQHIGQPREIEITRNNVSSLAVLGDIGVGFVLVADLAQDHFHQVL